MKTARFMFHEEELGSYTQYDGQTENNFEAELQSAKAELTRELYHEGVKNPYVTVAIEEDGRDG